MTLPPIFHYPLQAEQDLAPHHQILPKPEPVRMGWGIYLPAV